MEDALDNKMNVVQKKKTIFFMHKWDLLCFSYVKLEGGLYLEALVALRLRVTLGESPVLVSPSTLDGAMGVNTVTSY